MQRGTRQHMPVRAPRSASHGEQRRKGAPTPSGQRDTAASPSAAERSLPGLPLEAGLGFRIVRLARNLRASWGNELADLALTPPQAAVLRALAGQPGSSLRALARTLGADPMQVKRCVDELEDRRLVRSAHRGTDRRPRALALSPAGQALAAQVDLRALHQDQLISDALGPIRRRQLEGALAVMEDLLGIAPCALFPPTPSSTRTKPEAIASSPRPTKRPSVITSRGRKGAS